MITKKNMRRVRVAEQAIKCKHPLSPVAKRLGARRRAITTIKTRETFAAVERTFVRRIFCRAFIPSRAGERDTYRDLRATVRHLTFFAGD